ncbi:sugar ABC transporter ATP-binding protein [Paraburkholderia megapolitana]|uniref:Monosaccharide ABC transporter ATP-binding protein, CUT2 family n=1 Tax=Paraburkholderia megapolitana TaxID=420953 RepID=A0A1I3TN33_9BURK|nr:sugar ABC transporter ATP-binding protein [Paraburkholderia megapolitana]QDQ83455.1 sugar ABC transporter ATP-binding protein [Paraburkholderia megapolitana]SFJ71962.1 monosaccharide ABC transporter ATP-binding protein, CUT2 family [Paraburkholderia megapolitana]
MYKPFNPESADPVSGHARRTALSLRGVRKTYGSLVAIDDFSHDFSAGQVHALIGKNGSGKSTFIKLLAGVIQPDHGTIEVDGEAVSLDGPQAALQRGIATVYQELSLVRELSVMENIYLGRLPRAKGGLRVDWHAALDHARALLESMGLDIDPATPVRRLSVGQQQVVEIVKAMSSKPQVLLLDEPTSALASSEVSLLFDLIRRLRKQGVTMIYISHRLAELDMIADTVTVIRDSRYVGSVPIEKARAPVILDMMFGATEFARRSAPPSRDRTPVLQVDGLRLLPKLQDVSLTLHKGEVLGIAGMLGSGRTELLRAIYGLLPVESGSIAIDGERVPHPTPDKMKALGMGYTSENRKEDGLVQIASVRDNLCLAGLRRIAPRGWITRAMEQPHVDANIRDLHIKVSSPDQPVSSLSGGNQQKIVIGNWLNTLPKVLLFDEPSRGIDLVAKQQIFQIIWQQAAQGLSSIVVSTELEELLEVCDRILVMRDGRIRGELDPAKVDAKELYAACMEE